MKQMKNKAIQYLIIFLTIAMFGMVSESKAAVDTTLFRIQSLQDTVDAGDTIDVDLFIGDANHLADSIKEFELEIEYDLDICDKNNITFDLDNASMTTFFGTTFTENTTISNINGHVNIKVSCNTIGSGFARIGKVKYIVQDNVNGRQLLRFDFFKLSAKRLAGGGNGGGSDKPVKMIGDSTWVVRGFRQQAPTAVRNQTVHTLKIYPNPCTEFLLVDSNDFESYQLINTYGQLVQAGSVLQQKIDVQDLPKGQYILSLRDRNGWQSYPIQKE